MEKELLERLDRIERKLSMLMQEKKKETGWVKAPVITRLTGWDSNEMRAARRNGYVRFKEGPKGYLYDVDSLNQVHLKQPA